jgi:hypothetical protein
MTFRFSYKVAVMVSFIPQVLSLLRELPHV